MQTHQLVAHPAHPPIGVSYVEARIIGRDDTWLRARWRVEGTGQLVVPAFAGKGRTDALWQTTCFELYLKPSGGPERDEGYCELNLSPSERWNAYDFDGYRAGMRERPFPHEPECTIRRGSSFAIFDAAIPTAGLPDGDCAMGLCSILEEAGGVKSYWALAHSGDKPDFHDPACFAAALPAPGEA